LKSFSERKNRRKVLDPKTIAYFRNLFKKHLEGKTLSEDLINYVLVMRINGLETCLDTTFGISSL